MPHMEIQIHGPHGYYCPPCLKTVCDMSDEVLCLKDRSYFQKATTKMHTCIPAHQTTCPPPIIKLAITFKCLGLYFRITPITRKYQEIPIELRCLGICTIFVVIENATSSSLYISMHNFVVIDKPDVLSCYIQIFVVIEKTAVLSLFMINFVVVIKTSCAF